MVGKKNEFNRCARFLFLIGLKLFSNLLVLLDRRLVVDSTVSRSVSLPARWFWWDSGFGFSSPDLIWVVIKTEGQNNYCRSPLFLCFSAAVNRLFYSVPDREFIVGFCWVVEGSKQKFSDCDTFRDDKRGKQKMQQRADQIQKRSELWPTSAASSTKPYRRLRSRSSSHFLRRSSSSEQLEVDEW